MKKYFVCILFLGNILLSGEGSATHLELSSGFNILFSERESKLGHNYSITTTYDFNHKISFGLECGFNKFSFYESDSNSSGVLPIVGHIRYRILSSRKWTAYTDFGLGPSLTFVDNEIYGDFLLTGGIGVKVPIHRKIDLLLSSQYYYSSSDDYNGCEVDKGLKDSFIKTELKVSFNISPLANKLRNRLQKSPPPLQKDRIDNCEKIDSIKCKINISKDLKSLYILGVKNQPINSIPLSIDNKPDTNYSIYLESDDHFKYKLFHNDSTYHEFYNDKKYTLKMEINLDSNKTGLYNSDQFSLKTKDTINLKFDTYQYSYKVGYKITNLKQYSNDQTPYDTLCFHTHTFSHFDTTDFRIKDSLENIININAIQDTLDLNHDKKYNVINRRLYQVKKGIIEIPCERKLHTETFKIKITGLPSQTSQTSEISPIKCKIRPFCHDGKFSKQTIFLKNNQFEIERKWPVKTIEGDYWELIILPIPEYSIPSDTIKIFTTNKEIECKKKPEFTTNREIDCKRKPEFTIYYIDIYDGLRFKDKLVNELNRVIDTTKNWNSYNYLYYSNQSVSSDSTSINDIIDRIMEDNPITSVDLINNFNNDIKEKIESVNSHNYNFVFHIFISESTLGSIHNLNDRFENDFLDILQEFNIDKIYIYYFSNYNTSFSNDENNQIDLIQVNQNFRLKF